MKKLHFIATALSTLFFLGDCLAAEDPSLTLVAANCRKPVEQHYYMKTRGPLILEALRNIGFIVEDNAIQYHKINPYNKRKHAWLITAKKLALT